jgi:MFS family permease
VVKLPAKKTHSGDTVSGDSEPGAKRPWRPRPGGAFRHRNYRLFWAGLFLMVMGENGRWLAQGYLIQTITGEPIYLGLAGLATAVPNIAFAFVGGAIADRWNRQVIMLCTSGTTAALTGLTAFLVFADLVEVWHVLAIAAVLGTSFAFDAPARQALLPHLVSRDDMQSAVALNSAVWQSNRIVGPIVAGLLIATVGIGFSYVVTSAGYLAGFFFVTRLRLPGSAVGTSRGSMWANIREGLAFIRRSSLFSSMIGLSFMTSIFGYSYVVLLPVFALEVLDVGAIGFSVMETAAGVGAVLGTLSIAYFKVIPRNGRTLVTGSVLFGALLVVFSLSRFMPLTVAVLFAAGYANAIYLNLALTTVQLNCPDELRGRVLAVWNLTWVLTPLGGFLAGGTAQLAGAGVAVAAGGTAVGLFAMLIYARVAAMRRI